LDISSLLDQLRPSLSDQALDVESMITQAPMINQVPGCTSIERLIYLGGSRVGVVAASAAAEKWRLRDAANRMIHAF
jgi:hypothetical protein